MTLLSQEETSRLLREYRIPFAASKTARSPEQAVKISNSLGYPLVCKIDSPDVIHKTEAGGVITNIKDSTEAELAYYKIIENTLHYHKEARIRGVLVQRQLKGRELIVGMKRDPQFGPVILFGIGGVFVEVLKDVSRRIAPITRKDAQNMIEEIKGRKVLDEFRGRPPADKKTLVKILLAISRLSLREKNVSEIDFNPVIVNSKGAKVVDARMITNE